jgi:hypothetical protein
MITWRKRPDLPGTLICANETATTPLVHQTRKDRQMEYVRREARRPSWPVGQAAEGRLLVDPEVSAAFAGHEAFVMEGRTKTSDGGTRTRNGGGNREVRRATTL